MNLIESRKYRKDIDGIRALAVLSVIFYHFGLLPNGYLGVDIFFVISGYLITGIIYRDISENRFSIINFYLRRTRRIIPLVSFICLTALVIGIFTMLPDDLENLAQSIIATNIFSNNILQTITTKNYWDVVNEFKPLMHTWSLGIEEQYYLFYPFLFLFIGKKKMNWILPILLIFTLISLGLFFSPFKDFYKFYMLPFRFYELSIGGIAAILLKDKIIKNNLSPFLILLILIILCFNFSFIQNSILIFLTILFTCGLLITANEKNKLSTLILENKVIVFIGKISFSLYMWHQVLLAYGRYFVWKEMSLINLSIVFILTILFSIITFIFIEQPFRDKKRVNNKILIWSLSSVFLFTSLFSFYIYSHAGVLHDIPELDIKKQSAKRNMHAKYNDAIYKLDKDFNSVNKLKILVIGNSFARDWANILLESKFKEKIEISYIYQAAKHKGLYKRIQDSDYIFWSEINKKKLNELNIDDDKIWCIGTKNFGINNGIFYNYNGTDYCKQRTLMEKGYVEKNNKLKVEWKEKYIDLINPIIDKNLTVPVFTPECKFISQDCRHLTKAGAKYFAILIENQPDFILNKD